VPHLEEFAGTVVYMAPEQTMMQPYGKSVDIWAIGIIMYELLTGHHPFWKKGMDKLKFKQKMEQLKYKNEWAFPE
jgi:serine/threonine protein kinase